MCTERKQISHKLRLQVFFVPFDFRGIRDASQFRVGGGEREREKKKLAMRQGWEISPTRYKDTPHTMIHRSAAFMSDPAIQVTRGKFPGFCPSGLVHDNDNVVGVDIGSHLQGERKLESDIAASLKYRCAADK